MSVSISPEPRKQYEDSNGNPLSGGKLFFYAAGSSTKQDTYTTSAGSVANTNPIILDSAGRTPYPVWFTDGVAYKMVLAPSTDTDPPSSGVTMGDNLLGSGAVTVTQSQWVDSAVTPTYISASSFSVPGDQTSAFTVGRRVKCIVSGGIVYAFITASVYTSLTTVTIQIDSTTPLDAGLSSVSYGLITPTDSSIPNATGVFNASNKIINGRFSIAQAGTSFAGVATGAYDLDGWLVGYVTGGAMTISQDSASTPTSHGYARKTVFTTADASVAAADYIVQQTRLEGYNILDLINATFTVGFWVKSAVTGVHCVTFYNGTSTMVKEYTINVANTWEYKTVTVIGGTPVLASEVNALGLSIYFANMGGSNHQITADSWQAGQYRCTANQVNDAATINNVFALARVTLNLGTIVTDDEYDYQTELARCQRYWNVIPSLRYSTYGGAGQVMGVPFFYPPMRDNPTASMSGQALTNGTGGSISAISNNSATAAFTCTALGATIITSARIELASRL